VQTATAQMEVVGKRHYGLKALPQGVVVGSNRHVSCSTHFSFGMDECHWMRMVRLPWKFP
jgi:hypothetical protein